MTYRFGDDQEKRSEITPFISQCPHGTCLIRFPLHRNKSVRHHLEQVGNPVEVDLLTSKSDDSAPFQEPLPFRE
ncbi:hypothetical protein AVEN_108960-1 [Araneus ventricosus]|uniref:Uncharacterized protein n=1 Tax=Araneus ventricosus TaxID=182803 RepID=A0A4Y2F2I6_ARAVE|nr:hypothetical protein AVEN_108960-1 [Araneus ventricosus]